MVGQLPVGLAIAPELLLLPVPVGIHHLLLSALPLIPALEHKPAFPVGHAHLVGRVEKTLRKREGIKGIEEIGFPRPVVADESIQTGREIDCRLPDVLEMNHR